MPECQLIVEWTREDQRPVQLSHKVNLIGAKAPYNYIHLTLDPADRHSAGKVMHERCSYMAEIQPITQL